MIPPRYNKFNGIIYDVDIKQLKIFMTIVKCEGIGNAAVELNIDRTAVSKHLKQLEDRFGIHLCQRGRGGFTLTHQGKAVYEATQSLLGSISMFGSQIASLHGDLAGTFSIALADGCLANPECNLAQSLEQFGKLAPNVHLVIHVTAANEIQRGILDGKYHVGLIPYHHPLKNLVYLPLFNEYAALYCGRDHPLYGQKKINFKDIETSRYVDWGYTLNSELFHRKLKLSKAATVFNNEGAAALVLSGQYISFLPTHYAAAWVQSGEMQALLPNLARYTKPVSLVYRQQEQQNLITTGFITVLQAAHQKT